jgi:hypothetical protein
MLRPTDLYSDADRVRRQILAELQKLTPDECRSVLAHMTGYAPLACERAFYSGLKEITRRRDEAAGRAQ